MKGDKNKYTTFTLAKMPCYFGDPNKPKQGHFYNVGFQAGSKPHAAVGF